MRADNAEVTLWRRWLRNDNVAGRRASLRRTYTSFLAQTRQVGLDPSHGTGRPVPPTRDYAVEAFSEVAGMQLKVWLSNPEQQIWGAVYLWDSPEAIARTRPPAPSRSIELIGYPPTSESVFAVEAITAPAKRGRSSPTWAGLCGSAVAHSAPGDRPDAPVSPPA